MKQRRAPLGFYIVENCTYMTKTAGFQHVYVKFDMSINILAYCSFPLQTDISKYMSISSFTYYV